MSNVQTARFKNTLLITGGLAAGFMNGLLGAGGGILLVFILGAVLAPRKSDGSIAEIDSRDILANALASMLPVTAVSVINYASRGAMPLENMGMFILPAVAGGICGAWLLDKLNAKTVRKLFAAIVIFSGIAMIVRS